MIKLLSYVQQKKEEAPKLTTEEKLLTEIRDLLKQRP